jgi:EmrB/QacA subfamily drug resistance transporter
LRREELRVLTVVCLGTFFHIQSIGSISVSLAAIQKDFDASLTAVQWIGLMGAIMISSLAPLFGRAGDLIGRRSLFKAGLTLYTAGAGLAAASGSFPQLLAFRCVMAVGLAMAAPLAGAIVASAHAHENRGRALGLLGASIALGRTTGPTVGGFILHLWGWRAVFLANCLFGMATCLTLFLLVRGREERRILSFDVPGVLFLAAGYPSLLIALSLAPRSGWGSSATPFWLGLALAAIAAFVWRELRAEAPLMNLGYFGVAEFRRALLSLVLATLVFYPISIFGPLYLLDSIGTSPLTAGIIMAALPFWTTVASPLSGRLADRFDARGVATTGLAIVACGVFLYARLNEEATAVWIVAVLSLVGVGVGLFIPANEKAAFSSVPTRDYGMLSAMLTAFGTGSGALGTTAAVALTEFSKLRRLESGFAHHQQFAFYSLLPLAVLGLAISLSGQPSRARKLPEESAPPN